MEIIEDDDGWAVSIPDLPGCYSFGVTLEDAVRNVQQAKYLWMRSQSDAGGEIPEPTNEEDFSGKFLLRIPKTLHRSLAYQALKQGVSLNHYASFLLAERHPLNVLQRMLDNCVPPWRDAQAMWIHYDETPQRTYVLMGAKYAGDISAVACLSKPAPRGVMKVPKTLEDQYQHANDR